jgi:hypothetical protein
MDTSVQQQLNNKKLDTVEVMGHKPTSFQTNKLSLIMPLLQEV